MVDVLLWCSTTPEDHRVRRLNMTGLRMKINLSYQLWLRLTPGILPILLHPPSTEADRVKAIEEWGIPERTLPSFMRHIMRLTLPP